jgi:hypothetical protein
VHWRQWIPNAEEQDEQYPLDRIMLPIEGQKHEPFKLTEKLFEQATQDVKLQSLHWGPYWLVQFIHEGIFDMINFSPIEHVRHWVELHVKHCIPYKLEHNRQVEFIITLSDLHVHNPLAKIDGFEQVRHFVLSQVWQKPPNVSKQDIQELLIFEVPEGQTNKQSRTPTSNK